MANPQVAFLTQIKVNTTDNSGTAVVLGKCTAAPFGQAREDVDATSQGDEGNKRLLGRWNASNSYPCHYDADDAGQTMLRAACESGDDVWIYFCPDGSTALRKVPCKVTAMPFSTDGTLKQEFSLSTNGKPEDA